MRTLNLGSRPEYQRKELVSIMLASVVQGLKMLKGGKALKGGDYHQVGGEFLFEPLDLTSPVASPEEEEKRLGYKNGVEGMFEMGHVEEKYVTWCHRMRNTRDHAEIPELREVLGLDGGETPKGVNEKRWRTALLKRKGTGFSTTGTEAAMNAGLNRKMVDLDENTAVGTTA